MLVFGSTFDHKLNSSDINNSIDVDTFMYVYDHTPGVTLNKNDVILTVIYLFTLNTTYT